LIWIKEPQAAIFIFREIETSLIQRGQQRIKIVPVDAQFFGIKTRLFAG
jgi:hypothetical protein